jgi:hypothetical protein
MNYYFISAGIFLFISLLIHMIAGDKEYRALNPRKQANESDKMFGYWLMGRGTFQMVSVDLLLTSVFIFLMGINVVPYNNFLSLFIALLYVGYLVFWLFTLFISKVKPTNYLKQGQWMLFLVAFVLILLGL